MTLFSSSFPSCNSFDSANRTEVLLLVSSNQRGPTNSHSQPGTSHLSAHPLPLCGSAKTPAKAVPTKLLSEANGAGEETSAQVQVDPLPRLPLPTVAATVEMSETVEEEEEVAEDKEGTAMTPAVGTVVEPLGELVKGTVGEETIAEGAATTLMVEETRGTRVTEEEEGTTLAALLLPPAAVADVTTIGVDLLLPLPRLRSRRRRGELLRLTDSKLRLRRVRSMPWVERGRGRVVGATRRPRWEECPLPSRVALLARISRATQVRPFSPLLPHIRASY